MPDGVDRLVDSRVYRATYVTDWGEESAPSDVSVLVNVDQNDTVTISIPAPPAGRNITKWRLYRSNTGTASAAYQFVAEYDIGTLSVTDSKKGEQLGDVLKTEGWFEPPAGLAGLVAVPNGIMAGFVGNTVCFSDPYHPYAWPIEFQVTLPYPVVGLGVIGQGVLALTRGGVYLLTGADSSQMTAQEIDSGQACVNPRTIVSMDAGVIFATPDGLCFCEGTSVRLLTEQHITREDWRALGLSDPAAFAVEHEGCYFIFSATGCWVFDLASNQLMNVGVIATAAWTDKVTDTLCAAVGNRIHGLFIGAGKRTGKWRSKLATLPAQAPLAWITVASNFEAGPVTVRWFGDGVLRYTATFTSIEPQRLPPGRWLEHQVEVESQSRVTLVFLASSTRELQAV